MGTALHGAAFNSLNTHDGGVEQCLRAGDYEQNADCNALVYFPSS
ncbi:hypothetical protein KPSA1_06309 [Pseudomonas syringae pv. actinidiae]|uniref:Uncharacterized protein n=1 Tax=Pseudomonas syringae pv. actinidiae TaxID=103796 RepID=A0A2V0QIX9_PSESF|nr:hypothetical protein KPSA1_06309 [Pseudomonas syringae pv. actinidiae]